MAQFVEINHYPNFSKELLDMDAITKKPFSTETMIVNVDTITSVSVMPKKTYVPIIEDCGFTYIDGKWFSGGLMFELGKIYHLETTQGTHLIDSASYEKIKSIIDIL